jgi:hypothetical protein
VTDRSRELEISLRLKAARFLAGSASVRSGTKSDKGQAIALRPEELALRPPLPENRITANKLREIEAMKTYVTPGQVALIGQALGVDLEHLPMLEPANAEPLSLDSATESGAGHGAPPPPGELGRRARGPQPTEQDQPPLDTDEEEDRREGGVG